MVAASQASSSGHHELGTRKDDVVPANQDMRISAVRGASWSHEIYTINEQTTTETHDRK